MPMHQKQALMAWLTTGGTDQIGVTYQEAQKRLITECGIRASTSAIDAFFHRHRRQLPAAHVVTTTDAEKITVVIHLRK